MKEIKSQNGEILIYVIVFSTISIYFISFLVSWAFLNIRAVRQIYEKEIARQIAEAGTEYYRWHLAHDQADFQDGTGTTGPYVHTFNDKDGNLLGEFSLTITAPSAESSMVLVESTGKPANSTIETKITTKLAKESIAKYAVIANAAMRFGEGTEVFGPITSNGGIRFDGLAHNIVSSAVAEYADPDHGGNNDFGVHTHVNPIDPRVPNPVPDRPDVFRAGRQFPVPAIDFSGITASLAQMKTDAQTNGFYRAGSGVIGYHVVLKTNDSFDLYEVTSMKAAPHHGCPTPHRTDPDWSTWTIGAENFLGNYLFPSNGIIFLEDDIFIDGQIQTARVTVVAAFFPDSEATRKNIIINHDLLYTNYDGRDTIGLIAQKDISVGLESEDDLRIDGAMIAQNGRTGRYYYNSACSPWHKRSTLTLFGMMATSKRYGFAYTNGTGYDVRNLNYDAFLLYEPPPSWPVSSDNYVTLSWEETD